MVDYDELSLRPRGQRQFPSPSVALIVELGPPVRVTLGGGDRPSARYAGGFAAGISDVHSLVEHDGSQRGVQVDLTPTGARRLLRMPLSELAGRIVALRDLLPVENRALAERLAALPGAASRLDVVDFSSLEDLHASMQEVHPESDEVLFLVSGAIDAVEPGVDVASGTGS